MPSYLDQLSPDELHVLQSYSKVIVWGYPLHTHTHSYIHAMWVKVFQEAFQKDTYWFHDGEYPADFDYTNCLFIAEGFADENIPVHDTSVYFVHKVYRPEKYVSKGARLIEMRFNVMEIHDDCNYFKLDDGTHNNIVMLSDETKYERLFDNRGIHSERRDDVIQPIEYECIYIYWATDLLPHEFDYADATRQREPIIYYVGSLSKSNNRLVFQQICQHFNIQTVCVDPWKTPISFEENRDLMKRSLVCPDFRPIGSPKDTEKYGPKSGPNQLENGYLPCRVLKAMSYGQLGITDSVYVKNILGEHVVYHPDMRQLFYLSMRDRTNEEMIVNGMKYVQERHTYVNRARDLLRALLQ